jgi:hypothetical protein
MQSWLIKLFTPRSDPSNTKKTIHVYTETMMRRNVRKRTKTSWSYPINRVIMAQEWQRPYLQQDVNIGGECRCPWSVSQSSRILVMSWMINTSTQVQEGGWVKEDMDACWNVQLEERGVSWNFVNDCVSLVRMLWEFYEDRKGNCWLGFHIGGGAG